MLTIDRLFNGVVLVAPLVVGALFTGVFLVAEDGSSVLPITFFQIALIFSLVIFLAKKLIHGDVTIDVYGLEVLYALFVGLIFLSIVYTPDREEALFYVFRFIALIIMTYIVYGSINSFEQLKKICFIIIGAALLVGAYNLLQVYINPEIAAFNYAGQGQKLMRSSGGALDPNIFASNYFLPIMILMGFFSKEKSFFKRLVLFGFIGLLIGSVLLTYSRSSWVAIAIGTFVIIYYTKNYRILVYMMVAFLIAIAVSETVRQLAFSFLERFINIFAGSSEDSSKYRILLGVTAIYMILDSYLMGVGFQGFSTVFKTYHPPETTLGIYQPHNQFYSVFAELGIIGFILFIGILYVIWKTSTQTINDMPKGSSKRIISVSLFATFIAYLVFYNFLGGMYYNSILFIVIGLIFVSNKFIETSASTQTNLETT
ncbi:MAG: O-antigen ligase family protein [Gracilimonas sp.]|uniref:O-antigen ligase family protein n=1 Tax=Gracilimonas TaxID=649462 RepID=UPI001AFD79F8|nr:O-antigen ligase family protein [Gracilimonas sp.]MBO6585148.1 O-antigen ligase family protein [Gracilimonas sp.]MBO6615580.1 O-antigen ligase family protein [Gracilimonas sp.]